MRIGTWNLDGRWSDDHAALLAEQDCDVWLLTEVNESTSLAGFAVHRSQSLAAPRRRWAAVASRLPMTSAPDPHPASAQAQVGATTYVSVLPWRSVDVPHSPDVPFGFRARPRAPSLPTAPGTVGLSAALTRLQV
ncbi:hypothetical protein [Nocardioides xinjiangensis]|uniref:hypothetical protein n=1 Tax=Nocardioides xinjiangensis TaxID=2817376 RepID=UPI001B30517C|nr:hypothetical protein [Nocardioides sp. SYSU D00778]